MFLRFIRWAGLVCGTWYKMVNERTGVRRVVKCLFPPGICEEPTISQKNWRRHLKLRLTDLILAKTVFLSVWDLHCTRVRLTVIVSCSDELAVHSCLFLCLQSWLGKVASGLFYCWSLLRNNTIATNPRRFTLHYGSRRFVAWYCWMHTSWQVMLRDSDMLIAVSHVHLYFVIRSMSESVAMLRQVWKIHY